MHIGCMRRTRFANCNCPGREGKDKKRKDREDPIAGEILKRNANSGRDVVLRLAVTSAPMVSHTFYTHKVRRERKASGTGRTLDGVLFVCHMLTFYG
jgi:hypothetical protein